MGAPAILCQAIRARRTGGQDPAAIVVPRFPPKDLRHSFGTKAYRQSQDLLGVRKLMMHAKTATTERYVEGAVDESAQRANDAWTGPVSGARR